MAASTSGALKAYIESLGLGISAFRDQAPEGQAKPYVTIDEGVAVTPGPLEDGAASTGIEHVTVHLWMDWKNLGHDLLNGIKPGGLLESLTLPGALLRGLQGGRLLPFGTGAPPTTVYALLAQQAPRLLERDANIVHIPFMVDVVRAL